MKISQLLRAPVPPGGTRQLPGRAARVLLTVFLIVSGLLILAGAGSWRLYRQALVREAGLSLRKTADFTAGEMQSWLTERLADGDLFSRNPVFAGQAAKYLANPGDSSALIRIHSWIARLHSRPDYSWMVLVDTLRKPRLSVPEVLPPDLNLGFDYPNIRKAAARIGYVNFGTDSLPQPLYFYMVAPVYPDSTASRPLAYLATRINHQAVMLPILTSHERKEVHEEVFLLLKNQGRPLSVSLDTTSGQLRVYPLTPLQHSLLNQHPDSLPDYRIEQEGGRRWILTLQTGASLSWAIGARMDLKQAIRPSAAYALRAASTVLFLILMVGLLLLYLYRRQQNRLMQEQLKLVRAEEESSRRYAAFFVQSPVPICILSIPGLRFLDANAAMCTQLGIPREQLLSLTVFDIRPEDEHERLRTHLPRLGNKPLMVGIFKQRNLQGQEVDLQVVSYLTHYKGQEAAFAIIQDVSERERWMTEMVAARKKAEESDRLKSAFLANVSHEIRTPLNSIVGFSSLLEEAEDGAERQDYIRHIQNGAEQLLHIINDILDISRIEAGQVTLTPTRINLPQLLADLGKQYQVIVSQRGLSQVELKLVTEGRECPGCLNTDANRLVRVLSNLLDNALKFTHEGSITFGYTLTGTDSIRFFVRDTGIGIHPDQQEYIFERFRQAEHHLTRNYGGTGLGLAICKSLVELMGGTIGVISEPGRGAEFWFTLPLVKT